MRDGCSWNHMWWSRRVRPPNFGEANFPQGERSHFEQKTIQDSRFRDRNQWVLIPQPCIDVSVLQPKSTATHQLRRVASLSA
jgi:hypothetical protein